MAKFGLNQKKDTKDNKKQNSQEKQVDALDMRIIQELEKDSTKTMQQLSKEIKAPFTTIHLRKKKLEKEKIITGYHAKIDKPKTGITIQAIILIKVFARKNIGAINERLKKSPNIYTALLLTGDYQLFAKAGFKTMKEFQEFLYGKDGLQNWDGIAEFTTHIILEDIKK